MFPILFAIEEARSMEIAAMMDVVKKSEPSAPSLRLNLSWKKKVTQDLEFYKRSVTRLTARTLTEEQDQTQTNRA